MKLRIAGITKESVVDGPGIRYVIFTQGCIHNCRGCHNPETHDIHGGYEVDPDEIVRDINKSIFINGITFSGGEPFLQPEPLTYIAEKVKNNKLNIITYSGYTFEELLEKDSVSIKKLLCMTDILIDGKFIMEEKDLSLKFRGSKNQRIIDVKKSLEYNMPVLFID